MSMDVSAMMIHSTLRTLCHEGVAVNLERIKYIVEASKFIPDDPATVFIIVADHCAAQNVREPVMSMLEGIPEYEMILLDRIIHNDNLEMFIDLHGGLDRDFNREFFVDMLVESGKEKITKYVLSTRRFVVSFPVLMKVIKYGNYIVFSLMLKSFSIESDTELVIRGIVDEIMNYKYTAGTIRQNYDLINVRRVIMFHTLMQDPRFGTFAVVNLIFSEIVKRNDMYMFRHVYEDCFRVYGVGKLGKIQPVWHGGSFEMMRIDLPTCIMYPNMPHRMWKYIVKKLYGDVDVLGVVRHNIE